MLGSVILLGLALSGIVNAEAGPGPLVLHGGGAGSASARHLALQLAGGPGARVLVVTQAAADSADAGMELIELFREMGASRIDILDLASPEQAVRQVEQADLIWITSGNQSRLMAALAGTKVAQAIRERHDRGAVVGGTSAGTAVATRVMITGSPQMPDAPTPTSVGLDLWPGVIVDQHFLVRNRRPRLERALRDNPGKLGVGIDENTTLIVRGACLEVAPSSRGRVVVLTPHHAGFEAVTHNPGARFVLPTPANR